MGLRARPDGHAIPHEFSGGQRQRIGIARALALKPKLIVCDEPVSALDVSVQAQVINLLLDLQRDFGVAYLFIAHDLAVVEHISHRVAVMYLGTHRRAAPTRRALFAQPAASYTEALLSAVPVPGSRQRSAQAHHPAGRRAEPRSTPPPGCRFHTRCPLRRGALPRPSRRSLRELSPGHFAACHLRPGMA